MDQVFLKTRTPFPQNDTTDIFLFICRRDLSTNASANINNTTSVNCRIMTHTDTQELPNFRPGISCNGKANKFVPAHLSIHLKGIFFSSNIAAHILVSGIWGWFHTRAAWATLNTPELISLISPLGLGAGVKSHPNSGAKPNHQSIKLKATWKTWVSARLQSVTLLWLVCSVNAHRIKCGKWENTQHILGRGEEALDMVKRQRQRPNKSATCVRNRRKGKFLHKWLLI